MVILDRATIGRKAVMYSARVPVCRRWLSSLIAEVVGSMSENSFSKDARKLSYVPIPGAAVAGGTTVTAVFINSVAHARAGPSVHRNKMK